MRIWAQSLGCSAIDQEEASRDHVNEDVKEARSDMEYLEQRSILLLQDKLLRLAPLQATVLRSVAHPHIPNINFCMCAREMMMQPLLQSESQLELNDHVQLGLC